MTTPPQDAAVQVVAHLTGQCSIRLWVDTTRGPTPALLRVVVDDDGTEVARRVREVLEVDTDEPKPKDPPGFSFAGLHWWDVEGLRAGTSYRVEDDAGSTLATFRTLPDRLPLTIAVGSCYSVDDDHASPNGREPAAPPRLTDLDGLRRVLTKARAAVAPAPSHEDDPGGVAARYEALACECERAGRPIDLTLLLGDQVYVDQPWSAYVWPHTPVRSWKRVRCRYRTTWQRLGPLLSCGTNICVSEDHEYWNNYPHRAFWLLVWSRAKLRALEHAAHRHLAAYQQPPTARPLAVGGDPPVELFVADTRCRRTRVRSKRGFMNRDDFAALLDWISALKGPGVLVLGQPLLAAKGRWRIDTTLANYPRQHVPLCEAISASEHDIIVVCGDVHYGRYSVVPLASGRHLVEVVSSPMSLLASAGSVAAVAEAPAALDVEGHVCSRFLRHTRPDGVGEDHITLLRFTATQDGVALEVTPYYTRFSDARGVPRQAASWAPIVLR